ncbi:MAG: peptide chain release factor aRF-1 [Halobacteria archaeon]
MSASTSGGESAEFRKYRFRRMLEELREKSGRGTQLISLYVPPGKAMADVVNKLREEAGQAMNIKSKSTQDNVRSALESLVGRLKDLRKAPEMGLAMFCGAINLGADKTKMELHIVEPPEPVPIYKYHCDSRFFLEPLEAMLEEKRQFGLVVLDLREATVGILRGKRIESLRHLTSAVPGKIRKGGQSAARFARLREVAVDEFFQRIGKAASEAFLQEKLDGVLVGGPMPTRENWVKGSHLHHEVQKKIIGSFDVSYTDEAGLPELVERAQDVLKGMDLIREKELMTRFLALLSKDGPAAYGEERIRKNLDIGAVEVLLLSDGLRWERVTMKCSNCGKERRVTRRGGPEEKLPRCECGGAFEAAETRDVIAELVELARQSGAQVQLISTESEEGAQLKNAFGGMAAILRYETQV